jgi:hypothetical protein
VASIKEIRAALAAALQGIPGVNVTAYIKGSPQTPALYVYPGAPGGGEFTNYHTAMGNRAMRTFTVRALAGSPIEEAAQMRLDELLDADGDSSVRQVLEADKTLGGLVASVTVVRSDSYSSFQLAATSTQLLAAEWHVDVYT